MALAGERLDAGPRPTPAGAWAVAGVATLLLGLAAMLALANGEPRQVSLAVLACLLSTCLWAAAIPLAGPRRAFVGAVVGLLVLNAIRLPVEPSVPYRWRQALYSTDMAIQESVPIDHAALPSAPALRVLVEPHASSDRPRFRLQSDTPADSTTWTCPFRAGPQWLLLPLPGPLPVDGDVLPVTLRLTGQPGRDGDYLVVFAHNEAGGFLIELVDAGAPQATPGSRDGSSPAGQRDAPTVACSPAGG
jgi:hypothetical protein